MSKPEVYVSIDIESDGPIPGVNSMLGLGAVAYDEAGKELASFSIHLLELPLAQVDPDTYNWWQEHPDAQQEVRKDQKDPSEAMQLFTTWLDTLPGKPVCVAYPAGFDFTFIRWYLLRFTGKCPFGLSCIDIKTLAWASMGGQFRRAVKSNMPSSWTAHLPPHTHDGLTDAREQGELFFRILKAIRACPGMFLGG